MIHGPRTSDLPGVDSQGRTVLTIYVDDRHVRVTRTGPTTASITTTATSATFARADLTAALDHLEAETEDMDMDSDDLTPIDELYVLAVETVRAAARDGYHTRADHNGWWTGRRWSA